MKLLLIDVIDEAREDQVETRFPPLSLAYLAAYVRNKVMQVDIKIVQGGSAALEAMGDFQPDIIGMSAVSQNFGIALGVAKSLKERTDVPIVLGGHHISALPGTLSGDMDIAVIGEGEVTLAEIIEAAMRGPLSFNVLNNISGIAFKQDGKLIKTEKREVIRPLDQVRMPAWDLLTYPGDEAHIFTSRGCPFDCVFCSSASFWKKVRYHSPERVLDELKTLAIKYEFKNISIYDDLFACNKGRLREISGLIKNDPELKERNLTLSCLARADLIDEEVVDTLKELGVEHVGLGLESGCDETLKYLKGPKANVEANERSVDLFNAAGISVVASFVYGAPHETIEQARQSVQMAARPEIATGAGYLLTPFPGTPLWANSLDKGLVSEDMDWGRLHIDFDKNRDEAIIVAEKMSYDDLWVIHEEFRKVFAEKPAAKPPKKKKRSLVDKILKRKK